MIGLVKKLPEDATGKMRMIARLEELIDQANKGEFVGMTYALETPNGLSWGRCNMEHLVALGAAARMMHAIQKDWDSFL